MPATEGLEVRQAGHLPVLLADLADHRRRVEPAELREIHGALRLPGPHEDASVAGPERHHVPGAHEVVWSAGGIPEQARRPRAVRG